MKTVIAINVSLLLLGLAGCQSYRPRPLTPSAVEQALRPPPGKVLRVQAMELRHPLLPPLSIDLKDGLSPDEAAVLAVLLNPALRAQRDRHRVARAQLTQAGLLPNPQLGFSMDVPTGGQMLDTTTAFGFNLNWDVARLITSGARRAKAKGHLQAIDLEVAWQEWQTAMAAKRLVYHLASLEARIALVRKAELRLTRRLALVRREVARHLMTAGDLAAVAALRDQSHGRLLALQKQADQDRFKLRRLLGLPPTGSVRLQRGIKLPRRLRPPTAAQLLRGLAKRRLDLVALRRGYASQEAAVHAAVLNQFPRINLGLTRISDTSHLVTTGFAISISLPIFDRNQAKIAQERATRQRLFDEYVDRVAQAKSDVAQFLGAINNLNRQVAAALAARRNLERLERNYRQALQKNFISRVAYNGILDQLTQKRLEVIKLKGQLAASRIALELASGFYNLAAARARSPQQGGRR